VENNNYRTSGTNDEPLAEEITDNDPRPEENMQTNEELYSEMAMNN